MRLTKTLTRFMAATAAASLLIAPMAQADRGHHKRNDRHYSHDRHHGHNAHRGHNNRGHNYQQRHHSNQNYRHHTPPRTVIVRTPPPVYYAPPRTSVSVSYGYSYGPHYHRGYAPRYNVGHHYSYAPRTVYINDYHRHGLYAPPSGYHWVRDNDRGDAILASVATGAIIGLVVGALAN